MRKWIALMVRRRKPTRSGLILILLVLVAAALVHRVPSDDSDQYAQQVIKIMAINFNAYWHACAGHDEYEPVSDNCQDWLYMGASALDSVDTLQIMGLHEQYNAVRDWVVGRHLDHAIPLNISDTHQEVQIFELVIRILGGLNSAHALAAADDKDIWRTQAVQLGDSILHAFDTHSGCPRSNVILNKRPGENEAQLNFASTAVVGTLQLEMRTLSAMTNDMRYARAADKCQRSLIRAIPKNRVVPDEFNTQSGHFLVRRQTIGANVDSFVEMLLKTWLAFGKKDTALRIAFERQVEQVFKNLAYEEEGTLILGVREAPERYYIGNQIEPIMEHLSCFFPAVLALGALHGLGGGVHATGRDSYMTRARRLTRTCFLMSRSNEYGLAPESVELDGGKLQLNRGSDFSLLRPEIVESLYIMHAITGETKYKDWGKVMWNDILRSATVRNSTLSSVFELDAITKPRYREKLHSFVFAETLKYFYLLFRDDGEGKERKFLNTFVYNTEAHPVPIRVAPPVTPIV